MSSRREAEEGFLVMEEEQLPGDDGEVGSSRAVASIDVDQRTTNVIGRSKKATGVASKIGGNGEEAVQVVVERRGRLTVEAWALAAELSLATPAAADASGVCCRGGPSTGAVGSATVASVAINCRGRSRCRVRSTRAVAGGVGRRGGPATTVAVERRGRSTEKVGDDGDVGSSVASNDDGDVG
jgi:hypothetical protein